MLGLAHLLTSMALLVSPAQNETACPATATPEEVPRATASDTLEVVAVTPTHGAAVDRDQLPYRVQRANAAELERAQSLDLTDHLNRHLGNVSLNAAQNNPLQPDLQFRGFTASPLLGLPQGLAVYQDGVRLNDPLGDTVNWDLLPASAVASLELHAGAHPVFGLNALGGAVSVRMKDGFGFRGHAASLSAGSFGRALTTIESGGAGGGLGYYVNVSGFREDGWRDASPSEAVNAYATGGWRGERSTLDLSVALGDTELHGNGATPVELLARDRAAVFTHPDVTENRQALLVLEGTRWVGETVQLSGNVFYRDLRTDAFNGDGTELEACRFLEGEVLVEDGDAFPCDGSVSLAGSGGGLRGAVVRDQFGEPVDGGFDAVNNLSTREQRGYGASLQAVLTGELAGRENHLVVGATVDRGRAEFDARVEAARLLDDRGTSRSGLFLPAEATRVQAHRGNYGLYATDTWSLDERLTLTLSVRYDATEVSLRDRSGAHPELDGDHRFARLNPSAGVTYRFGEAATVYARYGESARAPTPVELVCADPEAPCSLPNAFLADPPLDQVVARSVEAGARGIVRGGPVGELRWTAGAFHTRNRDDILFQATGGAQANRGFFDNVGETRRTGVELDLAGRWGEGGRWSASYGLTRATFQDPFAVASPNHPRARGDGRLGVEPGDHIPGIPEHQVELGLGLPVTRRLRLGADILWSSGQYLRGDEANLLDPTEPYTLADLRFRLDLFRRLALVGRIENLFDTEYETFGLLGEPDEVLGDRFTDPRFLGPGPPRTVRLGIRARF